MDIRRRLRPTVAGLLALSFALAACSSAASPSAPPSSPPADGSGGRSGGGSGSAPGDPGSGTLPTDPGAGGVVPDPQGTLVFPKPGVIDPQPVFVSGLSSSITAGHLVVRVEWTSGVEPCYTLARVDVEREGDTFTLTVLEGSTGQNVACIEMAMYKATLVDLGELPAGTYTVEADPGDAAPLTVTIA